MACRFYMRNKPNVINYALSYNGLIFSSENKSLTKEPVKANLGKCGFLISRVFLPYLK